MGHVSLSCRDVLQSLPENYTSQLLYIHHATSHATPRLLRGIIRCTGMQASGIDISGRLFLGDSAACLWYRYCLSRPRYFPENLLSPIGTHAFC